MKFAGIQTIAPIQPRSRRGEEADSAAREIIAPGAAPVHRLAATATRLAAIRAALTRSRRGEEADSAVQHHDPFHLLTSVATDSVATPDQPQRSAATDQRAFTLLEVLLAVAVFAVVLAAITSVYFSALRLRNRAVNAIDHALPLQQALGIIRADLSALRPPGTGSMAGAFQTVPTQVGSIVDSIGRRISPNLQTRTGTIDETTPFGEVQRVAYFLANPTNGAPGFDLVRTVSRNLLSVNGEEFEAQSLLDGVDSAFMSFHDGNTWIEAWDSTVSSNLPVAIRLQITLLPPREAADSAAPASGGRQRTPIELVVPLSPFGNTNNAAASTTGGEA